VQVIERAAPQYILASMVEIAWIILIQRLGLQLGQQVVMKGGTKVTIEASQNICILSLSN
jgi:hypothetical protein